MHNPHQHSMPKLGESRGGHAVDSYRMENRGASGTIDELEYDSPVGRKSKVLDMVLTTRLPCRTQKGLEDRALTSGG